MDQQISMTFEQADILPRLEYLDDTGIDSLDFGVVGFDGDGVICRYNAFESQAAMLAPEKALGHSLFTDVAQCMNNFLVAQRFEDAQTDASSLDATIDYVLTWRMHPTKVKLRMLYAPGCATKYVLVKRLA